MGEPSAKVVLDSISPLGDRLTTMEVVMHRFVLSEFNTHRVFSRNSASSRAIPIKRQIARVQEDPAIPLVWGLNQPGMQAGEPLSTDDTKLATQHWLAARDEAVKEARHLDDLGIHKQIVNRLLEPFMWHTVIVSSTEWENFFQQRVSSLAQPEIKTAAEAMQQALASSEPKPLGYDEWHTPYILEDEYRQLPIQMCKQISTARCARVSYLPPEVYNRDWEKDLELFERLRTADPPHLSPFEHVATPAFQRGSLGNFTGWLQFRHEEVVL